MRVMCMLLMGIMTARSRKYLINTYGKEFYKRFRMRSTAKFNELLPQIEDIGDSVFKFNYLFIPAYFSWYDALKQELPKDSCVKTIWQINEDFVSFFPHWLLKLFAKNMYLGAFRKKALNAERKRKAGALHPLDWQVEYINMDKNTFGINIYECAFLKQAKRLGYLDLFPAVCRMDYLFSYYMSAGFQRTKTLGDGDDCCNCTYTFPGSCQWEPAQGFTDRK